MVILSISLYFIKTEEYKNWVSTEGTLIDVEKTYSTGGRFHVGGGSGYVLYYTYMVDGTSYQGRDSFRGDLPKERYVGEEIEVWYNPANHSRSMYGKPGPGLWPYVPFTMGAPIILIVLASFNRNKQPLQ